MNLDTTQHLFDQGLWREAIAAAEQALVAVHAAGGVSGNPHPEAIDLLCLLGAAAHQLGDAKRAVAAFDAVLQRQPEVPEHWSNYATSLRDLGEKNEALAAYARAGALGADDAHYHFNVAALLLDMQQPHEAVSHLKMAHAQAPQEAEIACLLAETLLALVALEDARLVASGWRHWQNLFDALLPRLANVLLQLGELESGAEVLKLALLVDPRDDDSQAQLVSLLERNNQLAEAEQRLAAWALPATADALTRARRTALVGQLAQRRGEHVEAAQQLKAALPQGDVALAEPDLLFALGKSQDALGQADACMETLSQAHAAQMRQLAITHPNLRQEQPFYIADFSVKADDVRQWRAAPAEGEPLSPLFVVAFPRSGTTLLEQCLDAHPGLCAMDEQPFLQKAIEDLQGQGALYPERLANLSAAQLQVVRRRYFERVAGRVRLQPGQRLVDKNPLNLLRLPAIKRLFPDATVLLVQRHPCDVLLSCYMQPFRAPEFARLCRSLDTLAAAYDKAFRFFYEQQALLGSTVIELRYETLTQGLEADTRRICEAVGLPWHAGMLDPAAHALKKGYISTPSYHQVVQPLNRKAVDRWRRYERYFEPVLPVLAPMMQRWGYV
jgi:tetratricopeptide (TPR) repeat protein